MTETILKFLIIYPFVLYLAIGVILLVIVLMIVNLIKGNEFSTPIFSYKPKQKEKSFSLPMIQYNYNVPPSFLSDDQINELTIRVTKRIREIKVKEAPSEFSLRIPEIDSSVVFTFATMRQIYLKIRDIVLASIGGWPGCSIYLVESFYQIALEQKLIPEELIEQMNDLLLVSRQFDQADKIPDDILLDIQYLAYKLNRDLDIFAKGINSNEIGYQISGSEVG